jgi:hypothetical protein
VVARVTAGCLEVTWSYGRNRHEAATVAGLAERMTGALREIVGHCAGPDAGGRTPSDFPLARLDQAAVDRLAGPGTDVEDVYPLTAMQAGMAFHGLDPAADGVYFQQTTFVLDGVDDPALLARAWQQVVDRTPVLRSAVAWDGLEEPVQIVHRDVRVPVTHLDWTGYDERTRGEELRRLLDRDRADGLEHRCCASCWPGSPRPRYGWSGPSITCCWTAGASSRCCPMCSPLTRGCERAA